ncbi:Na+/H+ antiporter subunit E [Paenibacillus antri]|uniref:Na+/H+ antiporter subunit E n=1 Tax=Paenibacillus antri TaxID=2582848 RepID=A0A5R9GAR7_9BACL|nr:Na+/H+ antiporter subunit E [Paenibacillus antri]TLS53552.1 Na+/H+ antiporter subunit E [Paenibacillus antri]
MAFQIVLNGLLALIWMLLANDMTFVGFVVGYFIGMAFLFGLRRFFKKPFYLRKVWAIVKLLGLFLKELVLSNIAVIGHIVRPRLTVRPGVFAYRTELRSDWEVTLLACLITLTPGTLTLEVSPGQDTLYIHAIDIGDADELKRQIKGSFERAIREVTR